MNKELYEKGEMTYNLGNKLVLEGLLQMAEASQEPQDAQGQEQDNETRKSAISS